MGEDRVNDNELSDDKLRVVFFTEATTGSCSLYRAWLPCVGLASRGHYVRYSQQWQPQMLDEFDLFVFQRNSLKATVELIYAIRQQGKPVIYDMDDDLLRIPLTNPVYWSYMDRPGAGWYQMQSIMRSSCLTVTTSELQEVYGRMKKSYIIPNWLNIREHLDAKPIRVANDRIMMFWGGSNTHKECLMLLGDVIPEIFKRYPNVGLVVMGDDLPFEVDWDRIYQVPWGKYRFFKMIMMGCDIGLAPLAHIPFNLGKSDLRIKELAAAKLPMVASNYGEYGKAAPIAGGLVANTPEEWIEHLSRLIEDSDERRYRSELVWDWAQKQDILLHAHEAEAIYRDVIADEVCEDVIMGGDGITEAPVQFSYPVVDSTNPGGTVG